MSWHHIPFVLSETQRVCGAGRVEMTPLGVSLRRWHGPTWQSLGFQGDTVTTRCPTLTVGLPQTCPWIRWAMGTHGAGLRGMIRVALPMGPWCPCGVRGLGTPSH